MHMIGKLLSCNKTTFICFTLTIQKVFSTEFINEIQYYHINIFTHKIYPILYVYHAYYGGYKLLF